MKYPLLWLIKLYQLTLSRLLGPVCKYYPSCSHYGYQAINLHGAVKGTGLTVWRILRCNPWSAGGVDHVPPRRRPPIFRRANHGGVDASPVSTPAPDAQGA